MTLSLVDWVYAQLLESDLPDEVTDLVLAALEGDAHLDAHLDDGSAVARPAPPATAEPTVETNGVVLTSVTVEGFRGIGPKTALAIPPKPGITVIAGRNGSGKSSFSEALELVLTGSTYRWENKSAEWRDQWRNKHHASASISLGLVEEGVGPITVAASWADGEKAVAARTVKAQVSGQPQTDGIDHLGWSAALQQFRPILSYDELGGMLDGRQVDLYDALASILGVEELAAALKRLKDAITARSGPEKTLGTERRNLQTRAAASTEERAVKAAALLRKTAPDSAALRALATGSAPAVDSGVLQGLRSLAAISTPDAESAAAAVARLRECKNALADAGAAVSQRNRDRLRLLEQGVAFHHTHGDQSCPVCRNGNLDATWLETSLKLVKMEREQFADVEAAHQTFDLAFDAARKLIQPPPVALAAAPIESLQAPLDEVLDAWAAWTNLVPTKDAASADALAAHVESHLPTLTAAVDLLREEAAAAVTALDDEWQPLAIAIAGWCNKWDQWKAAEYTVLRLKEAQKWLTENDLRLKNERLEPIESGARSAWAKLRQESNVELGSLSLAGSAKTRHVKVRGAIDGAAADSFAVFSQGELHALTLSLFLPRATLAASPFRFVVLDDPVQAMDPAKVDGLVELLGELARTRQVVVFSHDDRLAAALRRSSYDATILEVSRGANSAVSVAVAQDPTKRYLDDAHGLIMEWRNEKLTDDDLRRTLPGLYRFAIESAAVDRYFATRLQAGVSIHDLETEWSKTHTTKKRVNLAIFGEQPADHVASAWLSPPHRKQALGVAGSGFHQGLKDWVNPEDAHHHTKRLIDDIKSGAK